MSTLQIDLDQTIDDALTALATTRGTTPADLVVEIVSRYVHEHDAEKRSARSNSQTGVSLADAPNTIRRRAESAGEHGAARPDPLDAIVGSVDAAPVSDIDEVIYGR